MGSSTGRVWDSGSGSVSQLQAPGSSAMEEPTRLLNPEQEEQPEPDEEQDEPEEQEEPEKPRRGLLSRLRLLGSREEEDEPGEESESPADEEPEEEPGEEHGEESWQELEDYTAPDQAQKVMADLSAMSLRFVLRAVLTGVLAAALLWMGVGATGLLLLPAVIDPVADPLPFLTVNLLLCAAAALISFSTIKEGLVGLFGRPSATPENKVNRCGGAGPLHQRRGQTGTQPGGAAQL